MSGERQTVAACVFQGYRALARVLSCPLLAKVTLDDLITRSPPGARYARLPTPCAPLRHSELQCQPQ